MMNNAAESVPPGKKIAQYREYLGYSRHDLAQVLDLSDTDVGAIEDGLRHPSPDELALLARLFFVPVRSLTNGEDLRRPPTRALPGSAALPLTDQIELARFAAYLGERASAAQPSS